MWRELIRRFSSEAELSESAMESNVSNVERWLSQPLPGELRELLLEANGVIGTYGTDVIWTTERITTENEAFRSNPSFAELYSSSQDLLFFGDSGGGDQFAFDQNSDQSRIMVWDHETDERRQVADSLEQYLRRCFESDGEDWHRED